MYIVNVKDLYLLHLLLLNILIMGGYKGGGGGQDIRPPPDRFREGRSPPLRFRGKKCSQFATIIFFIYLIVCIHFSSYLKEL